MCKLHSSLFRGVGVAHTQHVVVHMLKGLLDIVFKSFCDGSSGFTGGDAWEAEASQFVVIRYLFPPYYVGR